MKFLFDVKTRTVSLGLILSLTLVACGSETTEPAAPAAEAAPEITFASQAVLGAEAFATNCAACHGTSLEGTTLGPLLSGFSWVQRWGSQTPELLLNNIQANMPPGGNDNITDEDYLNIVAHILQVNGVDSVFNALTASSVFEIAANIWVIT